MGNKLCLVILAFGLSFFTMNSNALEPGDKRTILTSGEKVFTIHYQLGQSTILYLGFKPDTVICGNKNYFNIEKIKEGLTIQPLGNFSTNLTVLNQNRRYLFYLTPSRNGQIDTFIDVRWVPDVEAHPVAKNLSSTKNTVRELGQKICVGVLDIQLKRIIEVGTAKRSIVEFAVKNNSKMEVKTSGIELIVLTNHQPIGNQVQVFDEELVKPLGNSKGRIIVTNADLKGASLIFSYVGKSTKFQLKGGTH